MESVDFILFSPDREANLDMGTARATFAATSNAQFEDFSQIQSKDLFVFVRQDFFQLQMVT